MTNASEQLQRGAGIMGLVESYKVAATFDIGILNRNWDPENPLSRPTIELRCRRWRVGEKDKIRSAADAMVGRYQEMGEAALEDPIGGAFEGGGPNSDEAWNFCMFQALILGWVIVPATEKTAEVVSDPPTDIQLAEMIGQCPELCATIVEGLDSNLKTQLSSAEYMAARVQKKTLALTKPSTGPGGQRKPSTESHRRA